MKGVPSFLTARRKEIRNCADWPFSGDYDRALQHGGNNLGEDLTMRRIAAAAFALMLAAVPAAAFADADAVVRMRAYDDAVVGVMKAGGNLARRADAFEPIVRDFYDMTAVSALVVGPGWATLSASDRTAVTKALTRHSAVSLARNFTKYSGERFTVAPDVVGRGELQLVSVTIATGGSGDTIVYRMRNAGGQWRIIDAVAHGVSQLALQRADLSSTIAAGGATGLVTKLAQLDAVK
jgi:phospholipid transport system substrate-binding protein